MKYNLKKKYQIAMRRLYTTNTPSTEFLKFLGIDKIGFIKHIEKYCLNGMTKENFGNVWCLDHIVPVDLFDFNDIEDLKLCYNYNNIMPMFLNDNRLKGASVHFSLIKLQTMYANVYIVKLIDKCNEEIIRTYQKYLIPLQ